MRRLRTAFWALAIAAAAAPAPSVAVNSIDLSTLQVAPNPRLGLSFPGAQARYYRYIAAAGIGVVRLSVSWERVEPDPGRFDWSGMDERIGALQAADLQPFLTFESDAKWATRPETQGVRNAAPTDLGQWQAFVSKVVERYDLDGRDDMPGLRAPVRFYQAANEWESELQPIRGLGGVRRRSRRLCQRRA